MTCLGGKASQYASRTYLCHPKTQNASQQLALAFVSQPKVCPDMVDGSRSIVQQEGHLLPAWGDCLRDCLAFLQGYKRWAAWLLAFDSCSSRCFRGSFLSAMYGMNVSMLQASTDSTRPNEIACKRRPDPHFILFQH